MKATLTLDDDVAVLLNQVHRDQGRSLEELGNDLLRSTLRHLGVSSAAEEERSETDAVLALEAKIDRLYDELRELVARSAKDPSLAEAVERTNAEIHTLQVEEAEILENRARARRHLKPGEGYRILEHAEQLLES